MCSIEQSIKMINELSLDEKSKMSCDVNFIHSKIAILTAGEYKGYSVFITDITPVCVELSFQETTFIFNEQNNKKIGEKITTSYGESTILDIIPEMYEIYTDKNEFIRLPCEAFKLVNEKCTGEVIDKKYKEHYGKIGVLQRKIASQYYIEFNRYIIFKQTMTKKLNDNFFLVKCGEFKNKIGKLFKLHENHFTVTLDANGRRINRITYSHDNTTVTRDILKSDLFNIDLVLKTGKFFKIEKIVSKTPLVLSGYEYLQKEKDEKVIYENEIDVMYFKLVEKKVCKYSNVEETEHVEDLEKGKDKKEFVLDEIVEMEEHEEYEEDDDEIEIDNYNEYEDKSHNEVEAVEMKSTFKDAGRLNVMEEKISEKDNEVLKMIEKCKKSLEYDTEKTFDIIEKVHRCVEMFKLDLLKLKNMENTNSKNVKNTELIKKTDYTFIIFMFLLYDLVKSGYIMNRSFDDYIEKLYNDGYLKGTFITGSIFLRKDKMDTSSTVYSNIQMSDTEYDTTKELLKKKKHLSVLKIMVKNCDKMIQIMFGKVTFNYNYSIEYIPIIRNNKFRDYPKYFITSKDLISKNISKDAKHILNSPLMNKWVSELRKKEKNIENPKTKEIYRYIITNFYKAPIILKDVDIKSDIKYMELERVYNKYVSKLDIHLKEKDILRKKKMDVKSKESMKILLSRRQNELSYMLSSAKLS